MTTPPRSRPGHRSRWVATATSLLLLVPFGVAAASPADAASTALLPGAATAAPATASGFLFYKFPLADLGAPACTGTGLNVSEAPFFSKADCGFAGFTLSGTATKVQAAFYAEGSQTPLATVDATPDTQSPGDYQVDVAPAGWDAAGTITMRVTADGQPAGETTFGLNLLQATFDEVAAVQPGQTTDVTGSIVELENDGPHDTSDTGVAAAFTLRLTGPTGIVLASQPVTPAADGTFTATIAGTATSGVKGSPEDGFRTVLGLQAVNASYDDAGSPPLRPATGTWAAARAGTGSLTVVSDPDRLILQNSFVSSVGWVKPGETYPSRLIVTNATENTYDGVRVTVPSPDGTTITKARVIGGGTATISNGRVTWNIGTLRGAGAFGAKVATLVLESRSDTLKQDPRVVWKNLSSTATLRYGTTTARATSRGPKVIPPAETFDTARYGDRPFPVVPVDYLDRKHQADHSGHELAQKINSPKLTGSTFNLYQEMSLGQLFPNGTVPSANIATEGWAGDFTFSSSVPQNTCLGVSTPQANGTPLNPDRIADGFYQLPGTTGYYGSDSNGSAMIGALAGVGALQDIDSGCGPTGKLVYDAAAIADPEIDYSDYDTDKDGVVDFFMVVFAGCGGHGASQLSVAGCPYPDAPYDNVWPHSSSLEYYYSDPVTGLPGFTTKDQLKDLEGRPLFYTDDSYKKMTTTATPYKVFVRVGPYNVNPETAIDKASVISHEYGHSLGLPDFYSTGSRETYGDWNLMASDKSQNMDVFSRQELGWIVPEVLEQGTTEVKGWRDSKEDTHTIKWQAPDGTPYTLSGPSVHNAQAYVAKLPGRQLIDPQKIADGASASHVWFSGSGNDFGCTPAGGHNLDLVIPGLADLPAGSTVKLELKSLFDIEWDFDYGFVLTTKDGGETYTSHASDNGFTTTTNPNANACQAKYGNGLTGSGASFDAGTDTTDRLLGTYPESTFVADSYDISDLAGAEHGVVRLSYATDPGLARPGWFIDDLKVTATTPSGAKVLLETDLEKDGGADDPRFFSGGCKGDLTTAGACTPGWSYVDSSAESPADHAYYMELRDRSGFDLDGHGENDREAIGFAGGLSLVYTDEAHGYGNVGTANPPAQTPLDSTPEPGSDTPNLNDAAWTAADGDNAFTDWPAKGGHTDNYSLESGDPWKLSYGCLDFKVLSMTGNGDGPSTSDGDLSGDVLFRLDEGCGSYDYGNTSSPATKNTAPTAVAVARPNPVRTGTPVALDASRSSDAETAAADLDYSWDFGDKGTTKDAAGAVAKATYPKAGEYTAVVTVTDPEGATSTASVKVVVRDDAPAGPANTAPVADAFAGPKAPITGQRVRFDGGGSTDAETPRGLTYRWDFDDGGARVDATGETLTHRFGKPGTYRVRLTVTDAAGARDTDTVAVRVGRRVSCESSAVHRGGSWRDAEYRQARGDRACDNLGKRNGKDVLRFSFTGSRLALVHGKARRGGSATILVDGRRVGTVTFHRDAKPVRFGYVRTFTGLGDGAHTARLVIRKGAGFVDELVVWGRVLR